MRDARDAERPALTTAPERAAPVKAPARSHRSSMRSVGFFSCQGCADHGDTGDDDAARGWPRAVQKTERPATLRSERTQIS
jgi:hypothetical protein